MLISIFNALALVVKLDQLLEVLVTTLIFVSIGLIFFVVAYAVLSRVFPIRKEIEEDQNTALGICHRLDNDWHCDYYCGGNSRIKIN